MDALRNNLLADKTELLIFSDAAKDASHNDRVQAVRDYIHSIKGFQSIHIIERKSNLGLASSIIDGVTSVITQYGKVIVLEDDLVTSPFFLKYMNEGLDLYAGNNAVASIHGYVYPIPGLPTTFFLKGGDCWGWATWKDRWQSFEPDGSTLLQQLKERDLIRRFDFNATYPFSDMLKAQIEGRNNSWAIRWHASMFLLGKLTLYPGQSLVRNIGNDGSGMHGGQTESYSSELRDSAIDIPTIPIAENEQVYEQFAIFFRQDSQTFLQKWMARIKTILLGWLPRQCRK